MAIFTGKMMLVGPSINPLTLLVSSAHLPALSQISWFSTQKPRLAQRQQRKQQQQTNQQTIAKPFQNISGLVFERLQF
jgi:hypothetical protein